MKIRVFEIKLKQKVVWYLKILYKISKKSIYNLMPNAQIISHLFFSGEIISPLEHKRNLIYFNRLDS